jgi:hypothetical protein
MNSVTPCTTYLTFGPWIYLVPQYKPESVLILGYAGGTVAGLIRLLYGDVQITAVDIEGCENSYGVEFIQSDAREYIKTCPKYDAVIVDIAVDGEFPDWVYSEEFAKDVLSKADYVCLNGEPSKDVSNYGELYSAINVVGNRISYFNPAKLSLTPPCQ